MCWRALQSCCSHLSPPALKHIHPAVFLNITFVFFANSSSHCKRKKQSVGGLNKNAGGTGVKQRILLSWWMVTAGVSFYFFSVLRTFPPDSSFLMLQERVLWDRSPLCFPSPLRFCCPKRSHQPPGTACDGEAGNGKAWATTVQFLQERIVRTLFALLFLSMHGKEQQSLFRPASWTVAQSGWIWSKV